MSKARKQGPLILVVGPSGVGKDTLIAGARAQLGDAGRFVFPRRYITRPADYGGEDHVPVTPEAFNLMLSGGEFLLHWSAHGFHYGVPGAIVDDLRNGCAVVVNGSRGVVEDARARISPFHAVHVTASRDVIAERLSSRGRESAEQSQRRLDRKVASAGVGDVVFRNDLPVKQAITAFADVLTRLSLR
ncbi:MAG: phosphonate metabolism protein/1,5-bisphosphokinase (PRPP-forming) PhnN [Alphaproteobacteria bacterium]